MLQVLSSSCGGRKSFLIDTKGKPQKRIRPLSVSGYNIIRYMLTLEQCKKILNDGSKRKFKDEEVKQLREYLYQLAELQLETE